MTNSTSTGATHTNGSREPDGGVGVAGAAYVGPMDHLLSRLQKGRNHRTKGAFGKAGFKRKRRG